MLTKKYYRIREVSELTDIPITTIRYWESVFPHLAPVRTQTGHRRYSAEDIAIIKRIKFLLRDKKMSLEYIKNDLTNHRKYPPRRQYLSCKTMADAIRLLSEAKRLCEDAHALVRINTVLKYLENK